MPVESPEDRTVEVLALPEQVDEELLYLYFENKRRSGGGPLFSVEKKGDRALLVFEDAEAAAQVLSKGHHVLHNVELCVRKPASKDQCRLLLRGINPTTFSEMIELYVENMLGLNVTEYTLYPSPGRDFILIHLSQPLSKGLLNAHVFFFLKNNLIFPNVQVVIFLLFSYCLYVFLLYRFPKP
uniref:RRM domain-containing protein n=1 Tax=Seriola dumerili TaxID=41447 RepID=A0A3B4T5A4_SERDU